MSEQPLPTPEDLARHLRQHLDGLRAAGVGWLPTAPLPPASPPPPAPARAPTTRPVAPVSLPVTAPALPTSLFAAAVSPAAAPNDVETRLHELAALAERVSACTRCKGLASTRTQTVFGVGPIDAELCFVGEAPGRQEDEQGVPFVGDAGQLLNRIIAACGLKREEVYICNILRCRPPGNRKPEAEEAENCREYLERQIELVQPKFLCCLGGTATTYLLGTKVGITRLRGKFLEYRGIPVMPTFHPSALLHDPSKKADVWEDMKKLLAHMGRPVPGRG